MRPIARFIRPLSLPVSLPLSIALLAAPVPSIAQSTAPAVMVAAEADHYTTSLPYTPGLDVNSMDKSADPCVDFYQYSCGGWIKNNPIPADQARWSVYGKLAQDNQRFLWGILDGLAKAPAGRDANQQKTGDYFAACMDVNAIEQRGAAPLQPLLAQITALRSKRELPALLARLQLAIAGNGLYFGFGANQDFGDSTRVIAFADAGGLGLPDRDSYLKTDPKSQSIRDAYVAHIAATFVLLGEPADAAARAAAQVMALETALAKASLSAVDKRDPYKLYHPMKLAGLQALTPGFDWHGYLAAQGTPRVNSFNVTEPAFFKALAAHWREAPLAEIQTYLRWHVTSAMAPTLSSAFDEGHFAFFSKTLRGVRQQPPRWKRCVNQVDRQLGEALGQEFVKQAFSPELKAAALKMTTQVEQAMERDITELTWMSPATKARAQEKLHSIVNKIGYPEQWRDYGSYVVKADDYAGNVERGNVFESRRTLAKIGRPLNRKEWGMTPPTVNAYYDPQMNDINFPAGVLQPPLYDPKMDPAPGYGNTGGTIGHELTHAFDDEGRQFDAKGNLKDWWTKRDADQFNQRTQCIVDQYAQYTIVDDIKINSKLTLGEDVADLGGLILGWMAWKADMATLPAQAQPQSRDGLTPEQRFFVGNAQWACESDRPENQRVKALTDPHSPGKYRVNGLMVNMPEFEKAFSCKPGQPMVSEKRCRVW